jgi:hypothetical protein
MDTVVFLGPSLRLTEAAKILPDAWYAAPCKCGDILRTLRIKPARVLLIDGYFSSTAAPWHKEFLVALEHGVEIYGASSMGAIRAAELQSFGMIGIGRIYTDYASGRLEGDDEVAVAHLDESKGYSALSDALCTIRYTMDSAVTNQLIDQVTAETIVEHARTAFYPSRTFHSAISIVERETKRSFAHLRRWLAEGNVVDQKRSDAKEALEIIRKAPRSVPLSVRTSTTIYIRKLGRWASSTPFERAYHWLPPRERELASAALRSPHLISVMSRLSEHVIVASDVVAETGLRDHAEGAADGEGGELARELTFGWESSQLLGPVGRWLVAQANAIRATRRMHGCLTDILAIKSSLSMSGISTTGTASPMPENDGAMVAKALAIHALIIICLSVHSRRQGLYLRNEWTQGFVCNFWRSVGVASAEDANAFLLRNGWDEVLFNTMMFDLATSCYLIGDQEIHKMSTCDPRYDSPVLCELWNRIFLAIRQQSTRD